MSPADTKNFASPDCRGVAGTVQWRNVTLVSMGDFTDPGQDRIMGESPVKSQKPTIEQQR